MSEEGPGMRGVIEAAKAGFEELAGRPVEAVSSVNREDGGWRLAVEVVELARIPDSTSLLGTYEVRVDGDGNIVEYERIRRYYRNRADEDMG
jgi:hypothetical protein